MPQTWICWATSFAILRGSAAANPALTVIAGAVLLLGVFAPDWLHSYFTERGGTAATLALVHRVFKWQVGTRWYVFALGFIPAIKTIGCPSFIAS